MKTNTATTLSTNAPRVYVGTYGKYNSGSIEGKWLDLEDYTSRDEFLEACQELHGPGEHEFMFQDFENVPKGLISESHIAPEMWDWLDLDDDERELLAVYQDNVNQDGDIDEARENFAGKFKDEEDWAYEFLRDTHPAFSSKNKENEILVQYFDFEAYARDARLNGDVCFIEHDGETWVFWHR